MNQPIRVRIDRDGHPSLVGGVTPSDSRLADWMLGIAIVALMAFACWKAEGFEGSGAVEVEETDGPRSEEP